MIIGGAIIAVLLLAVFWFDSERRENERQRRAIQAGYEFEHQRAVSWLKAVIASSDATAKILHKAHQPNAAYKSYALEHQQHLIDFISDIDQRDGIVARLAVPTLLKVGCQPPIDSSSYNQRWTDYISKLQVKIENTHTIRESFRQITPTLISQLTTNRSPVKIDSILIKRRHPAARVVVMLDDETLYQAVYVSDCSEPESSTAD